MANQKTVQYLKWIVLAVLLEAVLSLIRLIPSFWNVAIAFCTWFLIALFLSRYVSKISRKAFFLCLIAGHILINLTRVPNFSSSMISLPDSIMRLLGVVAAYFFTIQKGPLKWGTLSIFALLNVFVCYIAYPKILYKTNFGVFDSKVEEKATISTLGYDQSGKRTSLEGKYTLLDFWNTGCGVCFEKFPQLQALHKKYERDSAVVIYSVNVPLKRDSTGQAFEVIDQLGYTFPVLVSQQNGEFAALKIRAYPTVLLIDPQGIIRYRGRVDDVEQRLREIRE